jgi:putative nucleotidyltransferase with HDIG domain
MNSLFEQEPVRGLLRAAQSLAKKKKKTLYLVGGSVRDLFAHRKRLNPDIDFCLCSGAVGFARSLAALLKAGFVVLDKEHGTGRVVKRLDGRVITLDFSDFKGAGLPEDLALRDFTVNAMAVPLERIAAGEAPAKVLIDPRGGRRDLAARLVRMVDRRIFDDDPVRVMRAFSTAAIMAAEIEPATLRQIEKKKSLLARVSSERVRDELFKIFAVPVSCRFIGSLDRRGVFDVIFPEFGAMKRMRQGPYHHLDVWGHTLETLRKLERHGPHFMRQEQVREYLDAELSSGRSRWQLLKLAALLHDVGKPVTFRPEGKKVRFYGHDREGARMAADICRRLRLSNEEERFVRRIVALHLRPGFLATAQKVTAKALFRFFRDAGTEAAAVLMLSLADLRATRGYMLVEASRGRHERLIKRLLREYFQRQECPPPPRLVTGNDLIALGLAPSPLFGKILRQLEELQAEGKIGTKEQGLKQARLIIRKAAH